MTLDNNRAILYNYGRSWGGSPISKTFIRSTANELFRGSYPATGGIAATGQSLLIGG